MQLYLSFGCMAIWTFQEQRSKPKERLLNKPLFEFGTVILL